MNSKCWYFIYPMHLSFKERKREGVKEEENERQRQREGEREGGLFYLSLINTRGMFL